MSNTASNTATNTASGGVTFNGNLSPASLVNELKNPATYATAAAYIPTFWGVFHLPAAGQAWALFLVHLAAVLAGPLATIGYAIAHSVKAAAHESRLGQVESAMVALYQGLQSAGGIGEVEKVGSDVTTLLATTRANVRTVQGPAGKPGPRGNDGRQGPPGPPGPTMYLTPQGGFVGNTGNAPSNVTFQPPQQTTTAGWTPTGHNEPSQQQNDPPADRPSEPPAAGTAAS